MKKYAISSIQNALIGLLSIFCLQNLHAQTSCEGAAGPDRDIFIDYPISEINLDVLLAENSRVPNNRNLLVSTNWTFISGPIGPRGPRFVSVSEDDDVDFPNTGAGPDEEYVFEYTVTEDGCEDTAIIKIYVLISDPGYDDKTIYICSGESIENANELFNAFSLSSIRDTEDVWIDSEFNEVPFPLNEGGYTFFDSSGNQLFADVLEIGCSDKNVHFTFANPQNSNDGTYDYFEVDVMMQTISPGSSFKLGDGKLFFRYNKAAFGEFIKANNNIEITTPVGYIAGQGIDSDPVQKIYKSLKTFDNTNDKDLIEPIMNDDDIERFSWSFNQNYSSSSFASDNVNETPGKLCHIKIKYVDVNLDPMLTFESNGIYDNQFTTATICGSIEGGGEITNCLPELKTLITNDSFNSSGTTLSNPYVELLEDISLYPNPTKDILSIKGNTGTLKSIEVYSISGRQIMQLNNNLETINVSQLESSIYFVKLSSEDSVKTFKIIKE